MKSICLRWSKSMIMLLPQIKFLRRLLKNQPFFLPLCVFRQKRCSSRCFWIRRRVRCQIVNSEREDARGELGSGRRRAYFSLRGVVVRISPVGIGATPSEAGCLWAVLSSDSDESCPLAGRLLPPAYPSSAKCIFFRMLSIPWRSSSSSVPGGRFLLVLRRKAAAQGAKRGAMRVGGRRCIRYEYMALQFEWVICPDSNSLFAPNRIRRKEPTRPHQKILQGGVSRDKEEWLFVWAAAMRKWCCLMDYMFGHHQLQQRSQLANHLKRVKHLLEIDGKHLVLQHFANTLTIDLHFPPDQAVLLSAKYTEIPQQYTLLFNSLFHIYQSLLQYSHTATLQGSTLTFSLTALQQNIPIILMLHPRMASEEEIARHQLVRLQLEIALMVSKQRRYQMRMDDEARQIKMAIEQERKSIAEMENIEAELVRVAKEKEAEIVGMREFLGKLQKQFRFFEGKKETVVQIDDD